MGQPLTSLVALSLGCAFIFGASNQFAASAPPAARVRFHHFHFRVPEPAASMNRGATALNGSRVLLRGLGVGVRVGTEYALFDRLDAPAVSSAPTLPIADAYRSAQQWLNAHGVDVDRDASDSRLRLMETFSSDTLDHIAFTTADTSAAVAALQASHAQPMKQTESSRLYRAGDSGRVEIVRDLDAPDAFWCPMHLDIRSPGGGKCPLCGMELVPIPPPRVGEYRMDVSLRASPTGNGASGLRMTVRDPDTGRPAGAFATIHERLLHLFVIDRSLEYFRHVHPALSRAGTFDLALDIPPGEYVVFADFLPQGGRAQMLQRALVTPGYRGRLFASAQLMPDASSEKVEGRTRVRLSAAGMKAGREAILEFRLTDVATGLPVSDLEPFLGAPGHMLMVSADLTQADHVHPEEPATRGPVITFQPLMPAAGSYKLWLQFQRNGAVSTVPFVVSVESR